ncbi:MAG: hypothetical protein ACOYI4_04280 [Christensenellales bacterium]|jgi:hypothetical protein
MHPYESKYLQLLEQYKSGALTLDQFEEKVSALQWRDQSGNWYTLSSGGDILEWHEDEGYWNPVGQIHLPQAPAAAPQSNDVLKTVGRGLRAVKVCIIIAAIGLLLVSSGVFALRLFAPTAKAAVTDIQQAYDDTGKTVWNIVYHYSIDGAAYNKSYQLSTTFRPNIPSFEVTYLPFAPSYALRTDQLSLTTAGLCAVGGVVLLILFGRRSSKPAGPET